MLALIQVATNNLLQAQTPLLWRGLPPEIWLGLATVLAVLLGPLIGIQLEKWLEERRERKRRKIAIFRELMVTRASRLSPRHVEALNGVQLEFSADDQAERRVVEAWKSYINHLGQVNPPNMELWDGEAMTLLVELIHTMGEFLGYSIGKDAIRREAYAPRVYQEIERENAELRKLAIDAYKGAGGLHVKVSGDTRSVI